MKIYMVSLFHRATINQNHRLPRKHGSIRSPTSDMGRHLRLVTKQPALSCSRAERSLPSTRQCRFRVPMTAHSSSGGKIRKISLFCHKLPVVCFAFLQALLSQSVTFRLLVTLLLTPGSDCLQAKLNPWSLFARGCALACCD